MATATLSKTKIDPLQLVALIETAQTKEQVEECLNEHFKDATGNYIVDKNNCTKYSNAIAAIDLNTVSDELICEQSTTKGLIKVHYATRVVSAIQKEIAANKAKTQPTALDAARKAQNAGAIAIDADQFVSLATKGLTSSSWHMQLFSVCLLTGRRLGAVAFEASFEAVNPALIKCMSAQKQRGKINTVLIPVLADSRLICKAVANIRAHVAKSHEAKYRAWLLDTSSENAKSLSDNISASKQFVKEYSESFRPLFGDTEENYLHALRAVYACIIAECHKQVAGTANPIAFVQNMLDHDSTATTQKYLDGHQMKNVEQILETASPEFIAAMDAYSDVYKPVEKSVFPLNIDAVLGQIEDENLATNLALLLDDPDQFSDNLGQLLNRLHKLATAINGHNHNDDSASSRISRIVQAIMDYNVSQEGSTPKRQVRITGTLITAVGKLTENKGYDPKTIMGIIGGNQGQRKINGLMETEIKQHHEQFGIESNHNLFYRRGNAMNEIIENIAAQLGAKI